MIKKCSCKHEYQDSVYGNGMRVHTEGKDGAHRCTVCGGPPRWMKRIELHGSAHDPKVHNKRDA